MINGNNLSAKEDLKLWMCCGSQMQMGNDKSLNLEWMIVISYVSIFFFFCFLHCYSCFTYWGQSVEIGIVHVKESKAQDICICYWKLTKSYMSRICIHLLVVIVLFFIFILMKSNNFFTFFLWLYTHIIGLVNKNVGELGDIFLKKKEVKQIIYLHTFLFFWLE